MDLVFNSCLVLYYTIVSETPSAERHIARLNSWIMREDEDCGSIYPRNPITPEETGVRYWMAFPKTDPCLMEPIHGP